MLSGAAATRRLARVGAELAGGRGEDDEAGDEDVVGIHRRGWARATCSQAVTIKPAFLDALSRPWQQCCIQENHHGCQHLYHASAD